MANPSPFHEVGSSERIASNGVGFSIWDRFPVKPGHALVVPHRSVHRWWDLSPDEQTGLLEVLSQTRSVIEELHQPDGYNVGFNDGASAGQTVAQFHLIPRHLGDVPDPRGGVRHVIPERGNYLGNSETPQ